MGVTLALLIVVVNALVVSRGETVLARLGEWPLLGQVDVTAEAIVSGLALGLRAAAAMVAFAVYSACVDPDRVLRPAPDRRPLGPDRDPRLPPGPGRRSRRRPPPRRRPAARPRRRRGRPRPARPSPPRRLPRPGGRRRGDPGAARLRTLDARLAAGSARRQSAAIPRPPRRPLLRSRSHGPHRRDRRQAARRRRLQRLPDDRAGHRPTHPRPLGPRPTQRPGPAAPQAATDRPAAPSRPTGNRTTSPGGIACLSWRPRPAPPQPSQSTASPTAYPHAPTAEAI